MISVEFIDKLKRIQKKSGFNYLKICNPDGEIEMYLDDIPENTPVFRSQEKERIFKSTHVGRFFSTAATDKLPVLKIGDLVNSGSIIAIIQAFDAEYPIVSPYDCKIKAFLVEDGQMVSYGQELISVISDEHEI